MDRIYNQLAGAPSTALSLTEITDFTSKGSEERRAVDMYAKRSSESQLYDEQNTEHKIGANISRK